MSNEKTDVKSIFLSYASVYQVDLDTAATQGLISEKEAQALWPFLEQRSSDRFKSQLTNLFYYGGALLVIGSMTWFTSLAWASPKSLWLFWLALAYVIGFGYSGRYFWNSQGSDPVTTQILGGLFTTVAVSVSPMTIFALQRYFQFQIPYSPHALEVITLVALGLTAIQFVPFPFLTAPIACALYYWAEVDLAQIVFQTDYPTASQESAVSMWFGLLMLAVSFGIDRWQATTAGKPDFAFWGYLFGLAAFWGAMTHDFFSPHPSIEFQLIYLLVNLCLIGIYSAFIRRILFFLAGAWGSIAFVFSELYTHGTTELNSWISVVFGAVLVGTAIYQDMKKQPTNFPYWEYLVGVFSIFCGFEVLQNIVYNNQLFGLVFIGVHITLLALYAPTKQNVFLIFGTLGVLNYIDILVNQFASNYALPIFLTLLGLVLIALAVWLSKSKWAVLLKGQSAASSVETVSLVSGQKVDNLMNI